MSKVFFKILIIMTICFNHYNTKGQSNSQLDINIINKVRQIDFGVDIARPFFPDLIGSGYIFSAGYNYSNTKHFFYKFNLTGGLFGTICDECNDRKLEQNYYGLGFVPEIKYYPIKRKRNPYGFYLTAYSGAKLIYKNDQYFENDLLVENDNNIGALFWYFGLGVGYKISIYKGLYIEPLHSMSIGQQTFDYINYCDGWIFEYLDALDYLTLYTRFQIKIGYSFDLGSKK